jgi:trans-aconitate methyltransferase
MQTITWNAQDYARHSSQQQLWARELIAKLGLRGDERLLDIGSGDGKVTAEIAACLPRGAVLGIDSSEQMITLAQRTYPASAYPNLRFRQVDARSLPFNNEFDVVFSNATLHWVREQQPVVQGVARSLRPGGKLLLQMGGKGNAADILALLDDLMISPRWARWFAGFSFAYGFYGPDEYTPWLHAAGLIPRRVELIVKDMTHDGKLGLAGWIRTTWLPYTQRIPDEERDAFIAEIVEAYTRAHPLDAQGKVHVRMVRLEVEATNEAST